MKAQRNSRTRRVGRPLNGVHEFRLANGLKVLLVPDSSASVVSTVVVYRVGSRNEGPGNTGSAHFFEHLMFKGSKRFHMGRGNNMDALLKRIGARYNAYTTNDQTVYFAQTAAEYLELCLAIEADRMRGLRMTKADRDSEMTVVRNEMEQGENEPYQVLSKQLWATAFTQHPYHHDTIGSRTEVENVPMENMRDFYNTYYWPNNATLIVTGDVEIESALALIERHFGVLPRSPHKIPRVYTVEPVQEGERTFKIHRAGNLHRLVLGFHIPEAVHADMPALTVLAELLGNSYSRSSRLYKRLVDGGKASMTFCWAMPLRDPGLFQIEADLRPDASLADVEGVIMEELARIQTELVSDDELKRIKSGHRKSALLQRAETRHFAMQLAEAEAVAEWRWLMRSDELFEAVTAEDVRRVAARYLTRNNCTIGAFIPKTDEELADGEAALAQPEAVAVKPKKERKGKRTPDASVVTRTIAKFTGHVPARPTVADRIVSRTLANGLTIDVLPMKRGSGVVAIGLAVKAGNYFEGRDKQNLSDVVASMLPMGSLGLSKTQLADDLAAMGVKYFDFNVGPFIVQGSLQILSEELPRGLGLLETVLRRPLFEEGALETVKAQWVGQYSNDLTHPMSVSNNTLGNAIYSPADTFFQKTTEEQMADLQAMTVEDLRAFHARCYTPGNTIFTIVGDVDADAALAAVEGVLGDWTGEASAPIVVPPVALPEPKTIVKKMPDMPGISIVLGRAIPLKKSDADWYPAAVALQILGGDTLTARLGKKLREEGGLTYGVRSGQWDNSYGGAPWFISLSVNAANVEPAIKMTREIVADFVAHGITDEELATQVESIIGNEHLGVTTLSELAYKISELAALGLSLDRIDKLSAMLRAITKDDVNAVIRKYFTPDNLVTVIAGDVK